MNAEIGQQPRFVLWLHPTLIEIKAAYVPYQKEIMCPILCKDR